MDRTMMSINDFLDSVLSDFEAYIHSAQDLCKLWDTHYDAGRIPDYSDINIQQLYLLRYAYAYAFEYKTMYTHLCKRIILPNTIEVTSVGCGSMVDYWSLERVIGSRSMISYRGIDVIDWYYKFPIRATDTETYFCGDAIAFFKQEALTSDIYIFPKSISEFTVTDIQSLANCFTADRILRDKVCFLFSLRTDPGSIQRDSVKTSIIFNRMVQCGFHTQDQSGQFYHFIDTIRGKKIRELDDDFEHPGDTVDCLKELYTGCAGFPSCPKKEDCKNRLGRWPILNCNQAAWQLFVFER